VTARDRIVLLVVVGVAAMAGFWFGVLSPKRAEATKLDVKVAAAQQRLQRAQNSLGQAEKAKRGYQVDYATVARLGKAVPKDDDMPSLLYELQSAAGDARIDLRSLLVSGASQPGAPPTSSAGSTASGSSSSSGSSGSSTTPSTPSPTPGQTATATLPPGVSVGAAGFPTIPLQFTFQGSYSDMEHLLAEVQRFISINGKDVRVHGRLLTIDGLALTPQTFPQVKANISATAYLLPSAETSSAGTSAASPSASTSGDQPGPSSAPKVATPTATATGVAG
jgi:hypothetical protein